MIVVGKGWGGGNKTYLTPEEADDFFAAASISDRAHRDAIANLVIDLKKNRLWEKMEAIYPLVGGTSNSHSYNLKNTSKHRITYFATNHSQYGIVCDKAIPELNLRPDDIDTYPGGFHASLYVRNNEKSQNLDFGTSTDGQNRVSACVNNQNGMCEFYCGSSPSPNDVTVTAPVSDSRGFFVFSKINATQSIYHKGTTIVSEQKNVSPVPLSVEIRLNLWFTSASKRQYAFMSFGSGLTDADAINLTKIVNKYQTALGRAV